MFTEPNLSAQQHLFPQWPIRLMAAGLAAAGICGALLLLMPLWSPGGAGAFPDGVDLWGAVLLLVGALLLLPVAWYQQSQQLRAERERRILMGTARNRLAQADAVLDSLADAVSIQTPDFRIIYQNASHRQLVKMDATGDICYHRYGRSTQICEGCPVAKVFATGVSHRLVKPLPEDRGGGFIEILASPLRNAEGEVFAGIEVVRDISGMKAAEAAILQLNAALQEKTEVEQGRQGLQAFSDSLVHDICTHLTPADR